jgi:hypothetical protein
MINWLDPTDHAQGRDEVVLTRIGGELAQNTARRNLPHAYGGRSAEQAGQLAMISASRGVPPTSGRSSPRRGGRIEDVQPF